MERTGFEIEFMAPQGASRSDLAEALGQPVSGFKMLTLNFDDHGTERGSCELTPAYYLEGLTLVDDFSIHKGLNKEAPPKDNAWRLVLDDARLGVLVENRLRGTDLLSQFQQLFSARLESTTSARMKRLIDPKGHVLAVLAPYGEERERVCEVVTRPLNQKERASFLVRIFNQAEQLGFRGAPEGSIHVHFDAEPWQDSATLCRLILSWHERGPELLRQCQPNSETQEWRGGFHSGILEIAQKGSELPYQELRRRLLSAGLRKRSDLNLLGVLRPYHPQATLEARIFSVDSDILERLRFFEEYLNSLLAVRS